MNGVCKDIDRLLMLTRLRVSGFKNLVDIDVRFGPFTCIAGANGVGKSNLLDAIVFLSRLADRTLLDAALSVRDLGEKTGDVRGLFHHSGDHFAENIVLTAEMIIPETGIDDLGQKAKASSTFVEYSVTLRYRKEESARGLGSLELWRENLRHITLGDAPKHLPFPKSRDWLRRTIKNMRRTANYISTEDAGPDRFIMVHQDGGSSGRPQKILAKNLPRTVLSRANSAESSTATIVRREMQSWRLLQLEPSSLREPDDFLAPTELGSDGSHLPATLFHLANAEGVDPAAVYAEVANGLSRLIDDVRSVNVDRDERRQLLTLTASGKDGTAHPARSLSDGTLRFLALEVLSIDPAAQGLLCLEEPENGIHPERLPAMIQLLKELATDPTEDWDGPLRQVIINTHSPAVAMQVPEDSLLLAEPVTMTQGGRSFQALRLLSLSGTWRETSNNGPSIAKGSLLAYLNPVARQEKLKEDRLTRRVVDREDLLQYKFSFTGSGQ